MKRMFANALHALAVMAVALMAGYVPAAAAQDAKAELLWLGQSAMRIKTPGGKVIMIDP